MTRLFIRFYLGVIAILFVALCILAFAVINRFEPDLEHIKEAAVGDGIELARETVRMTSGDDTAAALKKLQTQLNYPIHIVSREQVPDAVREWLSQGDDVVVHVGDELTVLTPLKDRTDALQFGAIRPPHGSIETDMILSLGVVLLLIAVAIAIMLRPLARQLSVLEQTAISIASGNLDARVDLQSTDSTKTLARAFNDMAARTESLLRTQRELLQAVSHELRTPLARISFAIDLIRTARDQRERESRLMTLDTAAQELDELVGELLQYVRMETGGPQPDLERVELLPLVEELIDNHSLICEGMRFEIGAGLQHGDVSVSADRVGLARVLSNLLANASRFGRQRIVVDASVSSSGTTIDVDDDGQGIPQQDRERAFEPFVRLEETGRGAGLGLALVKRIVTGHGGTVTALESPLGGCRIRTHWPGEADAELADLAANSTHS